MKNIPYFYKTDQDFEKVHSRLKLFKCRHCLVVGTLILHGYLKGYDEKSHTYGMMRGHRVFCSNRNKKNGCGKTFSILKADLIKFHTTSANTIGKFIENLSLGLPKQQAFQMTSVSVSLTSIRRYLKKIIYYQLTIRTLLLTIKPYPDSSITNNPLIQTILHLKDVFNADNCPVTAFQDFFQRSFI